MKGGTFDDAPTGESEVPFGRSALRFPVDAWCSSGRGFCGSAGWPNGMEVVFSLAQGSTMMLQIVGAGVNDDAVYRKRDALARRGGVIEYPPLHSVLPEKGGLDSQVQ